VRIGVVTLLPEIFAALNYGVSGRALRAGRASIQLWTPRDYTHDRHRTVDDRPYGGGPGMVMKAPPLAGALEAARAALGANTPAIYLSPQGPCLTQTVLKELAAHPAIILIAGRYEGVDERFLASAVDRELSIGDYVLSGGEFAALVVIDGLLRLLPGVLGHPASALEDSFTNGLLDYPHYTRPEIYAGSAVPPILLSGNHAAIRRWRLTQALHRTQQRRPDLFAALVLTEEQSALLNTELN